TGTSRPGRPAASGSAASTAVSSSASVTFSSASSKAFAGLRGTRISRRRVAKPSRRITWNDTACVEARNTGSVAARLSESERPASTACTFCAAASMVSESEIRLGREGVSCTSSRFLKEENCKLWLLPNLPEFHMETKREPRVAMVSLGCPKALVDSERILTQLRTEGYAITPEYDNADVVLVNTCGFIDSAKAESLEAIGEAIAENGKVIVTGCMGVEESLIREVHPAVLAVTGPQQYEQVVRAVHDAVPPKRDHDPYVDLVPPQGVKLTPRHYAYLKISEGCNHRCSFCIIPSMRGDLVSRPIGDVMGEAERLVKAGVKELLVISQGTSAYGVDVKFRSGFWNGRPIKTNLTQLSDALSQFGVWVCPQYVYPYPHVDEVIPLMAEGKILPYLDIPFQHASPRILRAMKRPAFEDRTLARIHQWREACPDLTLRSTFIVGFPGETEEDFQYLLD